MSTNGSPTHSQPIDIVYDGLTGSGHLGSGSGYLGSGSGHLGSGSGHLGSGPGHLGASISSYGSTIYGSCSEKGSYMNPVILSDPGRKRLRTESSSYGSYGSQSGGNPSETPVVVYGLENLHLIGNTKDNIDKKSSPSGMNSEHNPFAGLGRGEQPSEPEVTVIEPNHHPHLASFLNHKRFLENGDDHDDLFPHGDPAFGQDVLQRRLKEEGNDSPTDSPETPPGGHDMTPFDHAMDHETQMSLVHKSEGLHIHDDRGQLLNTFPLHNDETNFDCDTQVTTFDCDESTMPAPSVDSKNKGPFVFKQFGSEVDNSTDMSIISPPLTTLSPTISPSNRVRSQKSSIQGGGDTVAINPANTTHGFYVGPKRTKEPSLSANCPTKAGEVELKIIAQPEDQHRARYMTEGSRGAIKDKSQQGFPTVKLIGYTKPINLQIFIGNDTGKVKPHGFYQACRVQGKNSTHCSEREYEGTTVIEFPFETASDMTAVIDSVGILKLRNADVEQRIGVSRSKKKSTRARLVFRVNIPCGDGTIQTLQVASLPISCTQPAGQPEICKKSLSESHLKGGQDIYVIGKNFAKGAAVYFQEKDNDKVVWKHEAVLDHEYFHQSHFIATVPPYRDDQLSSAKEVEIVVQCAGRESEPVSFTYIPDDELKSEVQPKSEGEPCDPPMAFDDHLVLKHKLVSPEAVAMGRAFMEISKPGSIAPSPNQVMGLQVGDNNPDMDQYTAETSNKRAREDTMDTHGNDEFPVECKPKIQVGTVAFNGEFLNPGKTEPDSNMGMGFQPHAMDETFIAQLNVIQESNIATGMENNDAMEQIKQVWMNKNVDNERNDRRNSECNRDDSSNGPQRKMTRYEEPDVEESTNIAQSHSILSEMLTAPPEAVQEKGRILQGGSNEYEPGINKEQDQMASPNMVLQQSPQSIQIINSPGQPASPKDQQNVTRSPQGICAPVPESTNTEMAEHIPNQIAPNAPMTPVSMFNQNFVPSGFASDHSSLDSTIGFAPAEEAPKPSYIVHHTPAGTAVPKQENVDNISSSARSSRTTSPLQFAQYPHNTSVTQGHASVDPQMVLKNLSADVLAVLNQPYPEQQPQFTTEERNMDASTPQPDQRTSQNTDSFAQTLHQQQNFNNVTIEQQNLHSTPNVNSQQNLNLEQNMNSQQNMNSDVPMALHSPVGVADAVSMVQQSPPMVQQTPSPVGHSPSPLVQHSPSPLVQHSPSPIVQTSPAPSTTPSFASPASPVDAAALSSELRSSLLNTQQKVKDIAPQLVTAESENKSESNIEKSIKELMELIKQQNAQLNNIAANQSKSGKSEQSALSVSNTASQSQSSITNNTPFSTNNTPFSVNTPYSANSTPFSANSTPFSANSIPFSSNNMPFSGNSTPFSANGTPFSMNASPFSSNPPFPAQNAPLSANDAQQLHRQSSVNTPQNTNVAAATDNSNVVKQKILTQTLSSQITVEQIQQQILMASNLSGGQSSSEQLNQAQQAPQQSVATGLLDLPQTQSANATLLSNIAQQQPHVIPAVVQPARINTGTSESQQQQQLPQQQQQIILPASILTNGPKTIQFISGGGVASSSSTTPQPTGGVRMMATIASNSSSASAKAAQPVYTINSIEDINKLLGFPASSQGAGISQQQQTQQQNSTKSPLTFNIIQVEVPKVDQQQPQPRQNNDM